MATDENKIGQLEIFKENENECFSVKTEELEKVLNRYAKKCMTYSFFHTKDSKKYSKGNTILNVTNIIITGFTGITITSVTNEESDSASRDRYVNILNNVFSILLVISAIINGVQQWANYENKAELHRTASEKYASIGNKIDNFLTISKLENPPYKKRVEFIKNITEEINAILAHSPSISSKTYKKYGDDICKDLSIIKDEHDQSAEHNSSSSNNHSDEHNSSSSNSDSSVIIMAPIIKTNLEISKKKKLEYESQRFINNTYDD
jgi:hypothetical protein